MEDKGDAAGAAFGDRELPWLSPVGLGTWGRSCWGAEGDLTPVCAQFSGFHGDTAVGVQRGISP